MYTIEKEVICEQTIKKSIFITHLYPVTTIDEVNDYLKKIKKNHYDATHNCYSYIVGEDGSIYKNSDDGEPAQTAGVVIYEVLKKNNLTNIICIVTRYFGGIKLGAGGLIRAYGSSSSNAVNMANLIEIIKEITIKITTTYPYANEILNYFEKYQNIDKSFLEKVELKYIVPEAKFSEISEAIINMTKNNIKIEVL